MWKFILGLIWALLLAPALMAGEKEQPPTKHFVHIPLEEAAKLAENGRGVLITYEQYRQLKELEEKNRPPEKANQPTKAILLSVNYNGTIEESRVVFDVEMVFQCFSERFWTQYPLNFMDIPVGISSEEKTVGAPVLSDVTVDGRDFIVAGPRANLLLLKGKGEKKIKLRFSVRAAELNSALRSIWLKIPDAPVNVMRVTAKGKQQISVTPGVLTSAYEKEKDLTTVAAALYPGSNLSLAWISEEATAESRPLVFTTLYQDIWLDDAARVRSNLAIQVFRAPINSLDVNVPPDYSTLDVTGEKLADWSIEKKADVAVLRLRFSEPVKDATEITINSLKQLEAGKVFETPRFIPTDSSGFYGLTLISGNASYNISDAKLEHAKRISLDAERATVEGFNPRVYQFWDRNYSVSLNVEPAPTRISTFTRQQLVASNDSLILLSAVTYKVNSGECFDGDLLLPEGWELQRFVSAVQKIRWEETGAEKARKIHFTLPQKMSRGSSFTVETEMKMLDSAWPLLDWKNKSIPLAMVIPAGVELGGGVFEVRRDEAFALNLEKVVGLEEIDVRDEPNRARLDACYRFFDKVPSANLVFNLKEPQPNSFASHIVLIDEELVSTIVYVDLTVNVRAMDKFQFLLPAGTGKQAKIEVLPGSIPMKPKEVRENWEGRGDLLDVTLQGRFVSTGSQPVQRFVISYERRVPTTADGKEQLVSETTLKVLGMQKEAVNFAVVSSPTLELRAQNAPGLTEIKNETFVARVPDFIAPRQLASTFSFLQSENPRNVEVAVVRHPSEKPLSTVITHAMYNVAALKENLLRMEVEYRVSGRAPFLNVQLPTNSELWGVVVNGTGAKPTRSGNSLKISLPIAHQGESPAPTIVKIVFEKKQENILSNSSWKPEIPVVDSVILESEWNISFPSDYVVKVAGGKDKSTVLEQAFTARVVTRVAKMNLVPSLLENQKAANDNAAQAMLKSIVTAQATYRTMNKKYAESLSELVRAGILNRDEFTSVTRPGQSSAVVNGYIFQMVGNWDGSNFAIEAVPESPTAGTMSYFTDTSGKIQMMSGGLEAKAEVVLPLSIPTSATPDAEAQQDEIKNEITTELKKAADSMKKAEEKLQTAEDRLAKRQQKAKKAGMAKKKRAALSDEQPKDQKDQQAEERWGREDEEVLKLKEQTEVQSGKSGEERWGSEDEAELQVDEQKKVVETLKENLDNSQQAIPSLDDINVIYFEASKNNDAEEAIDGMQSALNKLEQMRVEIAQYESSDKRKGLEIEINNLAAEIRSKIESRQKAAKYTERKSILKSDEKLIDVQALEDADYKPRAMVGKKKVIFKYGGKASSQDRKAGIMSLNVNVLQGANFQSFRAYGGDVPEFVLENRERQKSSNLIVMLLFIVAGVWLNLKKKFRWLAYFLILGALCTLLPMLLGGKWVSSCNAAFYGVVISGVVIFLWKIFTILRWTQITCVLFAGVLLLNSNNACADEKSFADNPPSSAKEEVIVAPYAKSDLEKNLPVERVYLPYDQFRELWFWASPDGRVAPLERPPVDYVIPSAKYKLLSIEPDVRIQAEIVIRVYKEGQIKLPLDFSGAAVRSATLTSAGKEPVRAELGYQADGYFLPVQGPFEGVLTAELDVRVPKGMGRGDISCGIPVSVSSDFSAELKRVDLDFRMPIAPGGFSQKVVDGKTLLQADLGSSGRLTLSWSARKRVEQVQRAFVLSTDRNQVFVQEGRIYLNASIEYKVSRRPVGEFRLLVPSNVEVKELLAPSLKSWSEEKNADGSRQIRVVLNKAIEGDGAINIIAEQSLVMGDKTSMPVVRLLETPEYEMSSLGELAVLCAEGVNLEYESGQLINVTLAGASSKSYSYAGTNFPVREENFKISGAPGKTVFDFVAKQREVSISAETSLSVLISKEAVEAEFHAGFEVKNGRRFQIDADFPLDYEIVSVGASGLDRYETKALADKQHLTAFLNAPLADGSAFLLILKKRWKNNEPVYDVPKVVISGLAKDTGELVVSRLPGIDMTIKNSTNLPAGDFGKYADEFAETFSLDRKPEQGFAFTYLKHPWSAAFNLRWLEPEISEAYTFANVEIRDELATFIYEAHYGIRGAATKIFKFETPADLTRMDLRFSNFSGEISDEEIDDGKSPKRRLWTVKTREQQFGVFQLHLEFEKIIDFDKTGVNGLVTAPYFKALGAKRQETFITYRNVSTSELSVRTTENLAVYQVQDMPRIPAGLTAKDFQGGFRSDKPAWNLQFALKRLETEKLPAGIISLAEIVTNVTEQGVCHHQVTYTVLRNRREQFMRIRLPQNAEFWSMMVEGKSVKPARDGNLLLAPLVDPKLSWAASFKVSVIYRTVLPGGLSSNWTTWKPQPPEVMMPVSATTWTIHLPEGYHYYKSEGNMEEVTQAGLMAELVSSKVREADKYFSLSDWKGYFVSKDKSAPMAAPNAAVELYENIQSGNDQLRRQIEVQRRSGDMTEREKQINWRDITKSEQSVIENEKWLETNKESYLKLKQAPQASPTPMPNGTPQVSATPGTELAVNGGSEYAKDVNTNIQQLQEQKKYLSRSSKQRAQSASAQKQSGEVLRKKLREPLEAERKSLEKLRKAAKEVRAKKREVEPRQQQERLEKLVKDKKEDQAELVVQNASPADEELPGSGKYPEEYQEERRDYNKSQLESSVFDSGASGLPAVKFQIATSEGATGYLTGKDTGSALYSLAFQLPEQKGQKMHFKMLRDNPQLTVTVASDRVSRMIYALIGFALLLLCLLLEKRKRYFSRIYSYFGGKLLSSRKFSTTMLVISLVMLLVLPVIALAMLLCLFIVFVVRYYNIREGNITAIK